MTYWALVVNVALSLCFTFALHIRATASARQLTQWTFTAARYGMPCYREKFPSAWRPRLFSTYLASRFVRMARASDGTEIPHSAQVGWVVGFWHGAWLLLSMAAFMVMLGRRCLPYVFGLFACVMFAYTDNPLMRVGVTICTPWDLPAVFFYALAVLLLEKDRPALLAAVVPVAVGFKETAVVLCVLLLLWPRLSWRNRLALFLPALSLCIVVKLVLDWYVASPVLLFTPTLATTSKTGMAYKLVDNVSELICLFTLVFANGGTLLFLFLAPWSGERILAVKVAALGFAAGVLVFGCINEWRILLELVPLALYSIHRATSDPFGPGADTPR